MDSDRERQAWSFVTGLVLGGVIGAGVALLTTPQSGRRTRRRIRRSAKRIRGSTTSRLDELAEDLKGKVDEAVGAARDRLPGQ
jgi:gas vesicle protein